MTMKHTVILRSEEFGSDEFEYSTKLEMLAGIARLEKRAREHSRQDGIDREIVLKITGSSSQGYRRPMPSLKAPRP